MPPGSAPPQPVYLAVLDGPTPMNWAPWDPKVTMADVSNGVAGLDPELSQAERLWDKHRFKVISDTPAQLVGRTSAELPRIVGVIADGIDLDAAKERDIEERLRALCARLAQGDELGWYRRLGFYVILFARGVDQRHANFRQRLKEVVASELGTDVSHTVVSPANYDHLRFILVVFTQVMIANAKLYAARS